MFQIGSPTNHTQKYYSQTVGRKYINSDLYNILVDHILIALIFIAVIILEKNIRFSLLLKMNVVI